MNNIKQILSNLNINVTIDEFENLFKQHFNFHNTMDVYVVDNGKTVIFEDNSHFQTLDGNWDCMTINFVKVDITFVENMLKTYYHTKVFNKLCEAFPEIYATEEMVKIYYNHDFHCFHYIDNGEFIAKLIEYPYDKDIFEVEDNFYYDGNGDKCFLMKGVKFCIINNLPF